MSKLTVESVIESFPNPSIPKFEHEPTYDSIKQVEKYLIENASSIESTLGGGNHGYLGLIMDPAKYQTLTRSLF